MPSPNNTRSTPFSSPASSSSAPKGRHHEPYAKAVVGSQDPSDSTPTPPDGSSGSRGSAAATNADTKPSDLDDQYWIAAGYSSYEDYMAAWYQYYGADSTAAGSAAYSTAGSSGAGAQLGSIGTGAWPRRQGVAAGREFGNASSAEMAGVDLGDKGLRVCRHFARGRCTWGNECRFSHDLGGALFDGADVRDTTAVAGTPPTELSAPQVDTVAPSSSKADDKKGVAVRADAPSKQDLYVSAQQQLLMAQRHAVLDAALQAKFQIRAIEPQTDRAAGSQAAPRSQVDIAGHRRGQVILTSLANAPDIIITLLSDEDVPVALERAERNSRMIEGGLLYLVGEASLFWSVMRRWHVTQSTGRPRWDATIRAQLAGADGSGDTPASTSSPKAVQCMFRWTAAGCLAGASCPFSHSRRDLDVGSS